MAANITVASLRAELNELVKGAVEAPGQLTRAYGIAWAKLLDMFDNLWQLPAERRAKLGGPLYGTRFPETTAWAEAATAARTALAAMPRGHTDRTVAIKRVTEAHYFAVFHETKQDGSGCATRENNYRRELAASLSRTAGNNRY